MHLCLHPALCPPGAHAPPTVLSGNKVCSLIPLSPYVMHLAQLSAH